MAAITRRTWDELRDEAIKRIGREGDTNATSRVEHWMDAVYRDLVQTYHHYELHEVDTSVTLSTSSNTITLPSDVYIVVSVRLVDTGTGDPIGRLVVKAPDFIYGQYDATSAQPEAYCRIGDELHFDSQPDAAYPLEILKYKDPTAPDFDAGVASPETDRLFDEFIVQATVDLASKGYWGFEIAAPAKQTLQEFLSRQVHPPLQATTLLDAANEITVDQPFAGGAQG